MPDKTENFYIKELMKNIGQEVQVFRSKEEYDEGKPVITGICKAINFSNLNVVIMTEDEKLIIKGPYMISRNRANPGTRG